MKPTAIQVAEDIFYKFLSPLDAFEQNPDEPVFRAKDVIEILTKYGHPQPDFTGMAQTVMDKSKKPGRKEKLAFSKKIKLAMSAKGVTNAELARITGKDKAVITRLLSGQNITLETIIIFQNALNIQLINLEL